jgi:hypothetical protein
LIKLGGSYQKERKQQSENAILEKDDKDSRDYRDTKKDN